jgi:transcriptional regulator with XRE-family HTH domain
MARAVLGWSFAEFGMKAGISKNTLVRFEAGGGINLTTANRIQAALTHEGITLLYEDASHGPGILISKELLRRLTKKKQPTAKPSSKLRAQKR